MAFLKRITPYAIAVLLLAVFYVPPPLGKTPYEYLRAFWLYSGHLPSVQSTPYDYLMFVVQWPFAVCALQKCRYQPLPNKFKIHGIWPAKVKGRLDCTNGTEFNPSEMDKQKELMEKLKASWPDLVGNDNMNFWKHEYDHHGRCSNNIFTQKEYFQRGDEMWRQYDVEEMFQEDGYSPGNMYEPAKLKDAVKKKTTKDPALRCKYVDLKEFSGYLLVEVVICYDHDGKNVIDCTSKLSNICSRAPTILYKDR